MFKRTLDTASTRIHGFVEWWKSDHHLTLRRVLEDEQAALKGQKLPSDGGGPQSSVKDDKAFYRQLNDEDRWALCLSGGGIRSASFALGVLQALARYQAAPRARVGRPLPEPPESERLLTQFDYLSTVSGGGYIGSWLSAWLKRNDNEENGPRRDVVADLGETTTEIVRVNALRHLRQYSSYLAPRIGLFSPDLWADAVIYVRNVLLNWLVILPSLLLISMLFRGGYHWIDQGIYAASQATGWGLCLLGIFLIGVSLTYTTANRPSSNIANGSTLNFLLCDLLPMSSGAMLLGVGLTNVGVTAYIGSQEWDYVWLCQHWRWLTYEMGAGCGLYFLTWAAAHIFDWYRREYRHYKRPYNPRTSGSPGKDCFTYTLSGAAFAATLLLGVWLASTQLPAETGTSGDGFRWHDMLRAALLLPWIVWARLTAEFVFVSLSNSIANSDLDREWLARADGYYDAVSIGWVIAIALTEFLPGLLRDYEANPAHYQYLHLLIGSGGVLATLLSLFLGSSSKTKVPELMVRAKRYLTLDTLAAVAAYLAGAIIMVFLSELVLWWFATEHSCAATECGPPAVPFWFWIGTFSGLVVFWLAANLLININRFSLHAMYRNRLTRAFLGASNYWDQEPSDEDEGGNEEGGTASDEGAENEFTDFDPEDNFPMRALWFTASQAKLGPIAPAGIRWRPFHVINTTLNLASTRHLDWQQRKAASFTISPLHCGYGSEQLSDGGAFQRTEQYGDRNGGISLGTAMATSGAAVNPNMGYHTSPGVALLMTMFNVRLGWWLGNPNVSGHAYRYAGPRFAFLPLAQEAFGQTSERRKNILLSDGGHFENLGLYEMVRRRCRVIVVSDAGCDPDFTFEDLGNAIRKIYVDFGIEIKFRGLEKLKKRPDDLHTPLPGCRQWAVADIRYRRADGSRNDGLLLYIKAGICGKEAIDVLQYAFTHRKFPHETTLDQFFTESQFESYRRLGCEIMGAALKEADEKHLATLRPARDDAPNEADKRIDLHRIIDILKMTMQD